MTAKGKINASKVQIGDRIIVKVWKTYRETMTTTLENVTRPSDTKTGEGVQVARVIGKTAHMVFTGRRQNRVYVITTTAGTFEAAPIQTMWLAPEDAAGVKRAHVEALAEDQERELAAHEAKAAELAATEESEAEEAASAVTEAQHAQVEGWLARHREQGTPRTQWSPQEDARLADHEEALTLNSQAGKVSDMANNAAATTENVTGSTVVRLLEKVWTRIREDHPELPEVVIITGSGLIGASKWGHFRADGWKVREEGSALRKHELFLAGEALAKGATQVLQTMLHEGAHTLAKVRNVKDTSRQNRWHNAAFKKLAEEMGLEHKAAQADSSAGFSFVTLTEATKARYADLLAELDAEISLTCHLPSWLGGTADQDEDKGGEKITGKPTKTEGGSSSGNVKLTCKCEEPNIVRASRKVADKLVVKCEGCDELFGER